MTKERFGKVVQKMKDQYCGLLDEQSEEMLESYCSAEQLHIQSESSKAFFMIFNSPSRITTDGQDEKVKTTLSWTDKHSVDAECVVSDQPDLLDGLPGRFDSEKEGSTD